MLKWLLHSGAPNPDEARRGRLLNVFILIFAALAALNLLSVLILGVTELALVIAALLLLLAGIYVAGRQGAVGLAAGALVMLMVAIMHVLAVLPAGGLVSAGLTPALFAIPVALAGVTLSWRAVLLVSGVVMADTVWLYVDGIPQLAAYRATDPADMQILLFATLTLLATVGLLALLSGRQIQAILDDLRRRNLDLEAANHDLAARSRREHQLSADISSLAGQLAAVSVRQGHGVATQARSIHQVASAVAQLHTAAGQITAIASEVSAAGEQARQSVQQAQEMVWQSREAVQRNRVQVQQVIERMQTLEQLTARITQFVNRIRDLSDETQLLALNATIEAAGAGTLGRRFGVVAAEVQNLSHRSNEIVDQIRGLISDLQQAGHQTQAATESSMAVADEVELLADQVRQTQEDVAAAVQRTSELAHLISTATDQQTRAAEQMTRTMHEIAQVSQATSQDTTALEGVVHEMTHAAGLLSSAIARLPPSRSAPA